jgi:hypothetical protein
LEFEDIFIFSVAILDCKLLAVFGFSVDNSTIGCNCCSFCKEQCSCQLCAVEFDNTLAQLKL